MRNSSSLRELVRAAQHLTAERIGDERSLFAAKWFDYRFVSPVEATLFFYDIYRDLYQKAWRKNFSVTEAERKRGVPIAGLWSSGREFNSVWRARQVADGLGLPYDFFIREAMEAAFRRGFKRPPRPNQLYHESFGPPILEAWAERQKSMPLLSALPQYRIEAYRNLPVQDEHQAWVVGNLKGRLARPYAIAQACFEQRVLSVERAEAEFSAHQMERVREEGAGMTPEPIVPLKRTDFWPSCFGIPHAWSETSPICAACHARADCAQVANKVEEKLLATYGVVGPRDAEVRAQTRARVARHRAERRAEALSASH
ncbi:hypothetical protein F6X53_19225 [Methylobacterium soli]|uniref:Uncharacterized protein n=1 Tax=Methylobacterium soli TaxID=553447 RepID=A0A6L3SUX0_9HYPH|nr:hypothetical protein F6X53_19225 [Methylobacterium soli]GJE46614.1 hypothetical protein AEGHOMDF_5820 [Methylobacterium soli]